MSKNVSFLENEFCNWSQSALYPHYHQHKLEKFQESRISIKDKHKIVSRELKVEQKHSVKSVHKYAFLLYRGLSVLLRKSA